jgi:DNA-binding beta-propeller fold protein YncE
MARVRQLFIWVLLAALLFGAHLSWRETRYGRGPQDHSGDLTGPGREIAFVSNVVEGSVSMVDLATYQVIDTLDVVPDGKRVGLFRDPLQWLAQGYLESRGGLNFAQDTDLSRDGRVLYVSRGYLGDVAAFDIASGGVLWRTPVSGMRADHMDISPDGRRLYVSALIYGGNIVEVLAAASGDHLGAFPTGLWPHDVHTSHDGARVYAASLGNMLKDGAERDAEPNAYSVTVVDAVSLGRLKSHRFESGVRPFVFNRDETRLYAQLSNAHALMSYDLKAGRHLGRLELPIDQGVTEADWDFEAPHHGLALTPDESTLCVAGRASDYAALVRIAGDQLATEAVIDVGDAPSWATLDLDGGRCLLPNTRSNDLSIISIAEQRELVRVRVGAAPKHVTVGRVPASLLN